MQALWLEDRNLSSRRDVPRPVPRVGEALVRVRLAGICATDLELVSGYYPFTGILGHEFVGQVLAVAGEPQSAWAGQRVVGEINISCGECPPCRAGRLTHCERRAVLGIRNWHGAFAEYLALPVKNLHRVPESLSDELAVFTEPLAAALEIREQVSIQPADRVLLIGAGRLGQLIAQTLASTGCELSVVARHPRQVALLRKSKLRVIRENEVPVRAMDLVVEATGSPAGFTLARQAVRPRGIIVLKSTYTGDLQVNLSQIVVDEITLLGSRCGPFPAALKLLESSAVEPLELVEGRYHLADGLAAFEQAARPGVLKILLQPPEA